MTQAKNNVSALELKHHLGGSYPTAWLLKHKTMEVMVNQEQWRRLTGRVEIDDAYLGGEVQGGKAGRGSPNKIPFVAAVQATESGQPIYMCLSQRPFTKKSIQTFAGQSLAAQATLVSHASPARDWAASWTPTSASAPIACSRRRLGGRRCGRRRAASIGWR